MMHSHLFRTISAVVAVLFLLSNCKKKPEEEEPDILLTPYTIEYPGYFPPLTIPSDNPLTVEGISLGRSLYYDPILSNNGRSCSSCHDSKESFSLSSVNSLAHVNLAWSSHFLWNGKISGTLEDVMMFEVEDFFGTDISKLNKSPYYKEEFKKVYKTEAITSKHVAYALAQFFRVMVSANSVYDRYFQRKATLNNSQMNGYILFTSEKGDCFHCHSVGLFADNRFHNIGLDSVFSGVNRGRYNVTFNKNDMGLFKTPTLRNIELTAPYMHDGRYETLEEVIEHYNSGVKHSATLDPIMTKSDKMLYGLGLTPADKQDLIAFLKTLTDTSFINNPLLQKP